MSSSVGTSKCSSPACMEARARRAAHCGYSDPHRPGLQYGDSFDSLGDSPHSDRWETRPVWLIWLWVCHEHFEKFPLSAGSLSASRGQSGHSERLSGNWHTAGMMKYAKVGKSERRCLFHRNSVHTATVTVFSGQDVNPIGRNFPL